MLNYRFTHEEGGRGGATARAKNGGFGGIEFQVRNLMRATAAKNVFRLRMHLSSHDTFSLFCFAVVSLQHAKDWKPMTLLSRSILLLDYAVGESRPRELARETHERFCFGNNNWSNK